jgi:quinoprotein glucose dehydrogenase
MPKACEIHRSSRLTITATLFTGDNNSDSGDKARIVQVVPGADTGWRMYYQYLSDRGPFNREKIWHPFHDEQPAYIMPPIANFGDGPSGLAFDPGTGVDPSVRGKFFLCDFGGGTSNSGIRSFQLEADGAFHKLAESAQPIWNVMATDVMFGPDGALWISDWVQGWDGVGKGRLYRVTGPEFDAKFAKQVSDILASDLSSLDATPLIVLLSHADRRIRNEATWELAKRGLAAELSAVASDTKATQFARLHAIWGCEQIARRTIEPTPLIQASIASILNLLDDKDSFIRAEAATFAGLHGDQSAAPKLTTLLADSSLRVRSRAALALAEMGKRKLTSPEMFAACVQMLEENDNHDPVIRHAGVMLLAALNDVPSIVSLKSHANLSVRRAAVVALRRLGSDQMDVFWTTLRR